MTQKRHRYYIIFFIIVVIQTSLLFIHMDKKETLSVDEVYTYSLANSPYGLLFPSNIIKPNTNFDIFEKWISSKIFKEYLTASLENRFNYTNVCENQLQDTHPPFYYYLIHTICSFFPNVFSKWHGLSLNIIFFVITQILLFHLSQKIFNSKKYALLCCILYGFSKASIDNFTFASYSSLLGVFNLLLLNFFIKILDGKLSFYRFLELFLIVLLGGFTHYLLLLYAFVLVIVYSIIVFDKNKLNPIIFIISSTVSSVVILYLLFPEMIEQLSISVNSGEIMTDIVIIIPGIGFISYFLRKFFCIPYPYFTYVTIALLIWFFTYGCWKIINYYCNNKNRKSICLIITPIILMFLLLSFHINYNDTNQNYIKYFFCYYPIVTIILLFIAKCFKKSYILITFIVWTSIVPSYCLYLTSINDNQSSIEETLKNNNVILVFNNYQDIQLIAPYLLLSDNVFLLPLNATTLDDIVFSQLPLMPSTGKNYMLLTNKITYNGSKYPVILSKNITNEKVDVYDITNTK